MKKILLLIIILIFMENVKAQDADTTKDGQMKKYYMVFLRSGPNKDYSDTAKINKYQAGHIANIVRVYEMGKMDIAGPFGGNTELRGIFIMNVKNESEIKELLADDIYIKEGYLVYDYLPWYAEKGAKLR
ncbi:MAG: hypothetical protein KBG21_04190 [Ignavibacteria bacterium]|mgnify:CR=1 FL=1|nr:hypothetical protein [Ignavibacteria bacterium]